MKYEITDKVSYTTVHFTVESEDGSREYRVSMAENDIFDEWRVMDEEGNDIDHNVDLYDTLIAMCEAELKR
jgi:hypothetical protein